MSEKQRRYLKTAKGRATQARYKATSKGQASIAKMRAKHGPTGRLTERRRCRELVVRLKSAPCADCKKKYNPVCMDFDHRPGTVKLFAIGARKTPGYFMLTAEIAKCDVVCSNCHRLRTWHRAIEKRDANRVQA